MDKRPFERAAAPWLLTVISFLVVFTLLPNNRSSIMVKELAYVIGSSAMCLLLASAVFRGVSLNPSVDSRIAGVFVLLIGWMTARHFTGTGSVNGPQVVMSFAFLGLLSGATALLLDSRGVRIVLVALAVQMGLLCAYSMLQWANVVVFPWDVYLGSGGRVSGSLGNPNLLGGVLSAFIPVSIGLLLGKGARKTVRYSLLASLILLSLLSMIASGTRSSLIGLLFGLMTLAYLVMRSSGRGGSRNWSILLLGLATFAFAAFFMRERLVELASLGEGTARVRLVIWSGAIALIAANPFLGWGPGAFQILFPSVRNPMYSILGVSHNTLHVHCEYLEILVETGLIGGLLFAALAALMTRSSVRRGPMKREMSLVDFGLIAGIASFLAEAFVSVSLRWPPGAFLFAVLCGLFLAGGPGSPRPLPRVTGALLLLPALFAALWGGGDYIRSLRSGNNLFMGKDQYLDKIETELMLASGAAAAYEQTGQESRLEEALQRYQTAWIYSDSSIAICTRCVEVNPDELGGWYGLGSAWLTRAILIKPSNRSLSRVLEAEGLLRDENLALEATLQALAAYESLRTRAPDYAELNNNFALTYTRLGMPGMTMVAMRRAYDLHGHRRPDYILQAESLAPLGGGFDALHMIWSDKLASINSADPARIESFVASAEWTSGLAMLFNPESADSLASALAGQCGILPEDLADRVSTDLAGQAAMAACDAEMFWRAMACDTAGLLEAAERGLDSSRAILPGHVAALAVAGAMRGDSAGFAGMLDFSSHLSYDGFEWLSLWPENAGIPAGALSHITEAGPPERWRLVFLELVSRMMQTDSYLLNRIQISRTDFRESVTPATLEGLLRVWNGVGGLQASLDQGSAEPWIRGSVLSTAAMLVDSISRTGREGILTRMAFDYLTTSSFWWNGSGFGDRYRDIMLVRLDEGRTALEEALGPEEAMYETSRLFQQIDPLVEQTIEAERLPFLEILKNGVIEGTVMRSTEAPPVAS